MQQYTISNYPPVIEPTAEILEIIGGTDNLQRSHLYRIATQVVLDRLSGITNGLVHFFGLSPDLDSNQFILAYTSGGLLSQLLWREKQNWDVALIPIEAIGQPVVHPSLRLVFKTERARAAMLHYISQVIDQKVHNPSLAIVFEQFAEPPLVIDVWKSK